MTIWCYPSHQMISRSLLRSPKMGKGLKYLFLKNILVKDYLIRNYLCLCLFYPKLLDWWEFNFFPPLIVLRFSK